MAHTLINAFEVPPGADEEFVAGWERARAYLAERDAFHSTALYRALRADVALRFVNIAVIDAPAVWRDAVEDPGSVGKRLLVSSAGTVR